MGCALSTLFKADAEGFPSHGDAVNAFIAFFERDVVDVFGLLVDFLRNRRREALNVRVAEDVPGQGGVYMRGVCVWADTCSTGAAVHPAGVEGWTAGHRGQLELDAGAAAVQDRPVAVVR